MEKICLTEIYLFNDIIYCLFRRQNLTHAKASCHVGQNGKEKAKGTTKK